MIESKTITEIKASAGDNPYFVALKCRECGKRYPKVAIHICEDDFGPLECAYDYDAIANRLTREEIALRPKSMWRYRELLPIDGPPTVGLQVGYTPLVRADNLARVLGVDEIYIKNDAVNYPTLSFKDRVVAVALSRAREMGFETVACASTGNLANSVAANSAAAGMKSFVFIPYDLERSKVLNSLVYGTRLVGIRGPYDQVNRLCSEIAGKYGWGFVNVNLRPYYAEGSKTMGFEIAEQLGWRVPQHTVIPMASGSLLTKIHKAYTELQRIGLVADSRFSVYGAQASGCAPIAQAWKSRSEIINFVREPRTIAKSLAIGTPADGYYAVGSMRVTGGAAEDCSDEEIVEAIRLLAETEGIFAETAGGVTLACTKKLIESGSIPRHQSIVVCITGNGLKTVEAITDRLPSPDVINPSLKDFDALLASS